MCSKALIQKRQHMRLVRIRSRLVKIDMSSVGNKPELLWTFGAFKQHLRVCAASVAIDFAAQDQDWTTDVRDMINWA